MYEQNVSQKHVKPATNGGKVSPQAKLQYFIFNINGSMIFQKVWGEDFKLKVPVINN